MRNKITATETFEWNCPIEFEKMHRKQSIKLIKIVK
jgi:hypothetical protein